jgi:hypothetical protein
MWRRLAGTRWGGRAGKMPAEGPAGSRRSAPYCAAGDGRGKLDERPPVLTPPPSKFDERFASVDSTDLKSYEPHHQC